MAWVVTGIAVGTGVGLLNSAQQRAAKKDELLANAAQIQYSPWTGMKSSVQGFGGTPTALGGALQGGVAGGMMGSQFGKATSGPSQTPVTDSGMGEAPVVGQEVVPQKQRYGLGLKLT